LQTSNQHSFIHPSHALAAAKIRQSRSNFFLMNFPFIFINKTTLVIVFAAAVVFKFFL